MNKHTPLFMWLLVLMVNIGACLVIMLSELYRGLSLTDLIDSFSQPHISFFLFWFLLITVVSTLISTLPIKRRGYIGYGIPVLIILYGIGHYVACINKFCSLFDAPIFVAALAFAFFYTLAIRLYRSSPKTLISLLWLGFSILLLITFAILYTLFT